MANPRRHHSDLVEDIESRTTSSAAPTPAQTASPPPEPRESTTARTTTPSQPSNMPQLRRAPTATSTCWICQQTPSEDGPDASPWRRPCPCTATAHEACLLDWHDSMATASTPDTQLKCPLCKHPIAIRTPHRPLLTAISRFQRVCRRSILPFAGVTVLGILHSGSMVYGSNAMNVVFGPQMAAAMVRSDGQHPLWENMPIWDVISPLADSMLFWVHRDQRKLSLSAWLGLPLIAPVLVGIRVESWARWISAITPMLYFLWPNRSRRPVGSNDWRGLTPGRVFFLDLPLLYELYTFTYRYFFAEAERRWTLALQRRPREGENAEDIAGDEGEEGLIGGFGNVHLEMHMAEIIEEEDEDEEVMPEMANGMPDANIAAAGQQPADQQPALNNVVGPNNENPVEAPAVPAPEAQDRPADDQPAEPANDEAPPVVQQDRNRPPPEQGRPARRQRNTSTSLVAVLTSASTSLLLPWLSSCAGDVLFFSLSRLPHPGLRSLLGLRGTPAAAAAAGNIASRNSTTSWWWSLLLDPFGTTAMRDEVLRRRRPVGWWVWEERWARTVLGGVVLVVLRDAVVLYSKWRRASDQRVRSVLDYEGRRR